MRTLALSVGAIIAVVGLVGIAYPELLIALFRNSVTPPALYGVAVIQAMDGLSQRGNHLAIDFDGHSAAIVTKPVKQVGDGDDFSNCPGFAVNRDLHHSG